MSDEILQYNKIQPKNYAEICDVLLDTITKALKNGTVKLYHGSPAWFIDENPIVGYNTSKQAVNVLFWSGQSFDEPELVAVGKHKAAQLSYQDVKDVDKEFLNRCLEKSKEIVWNYKDIIKNKGKLSLIKLD